MLFLALVVTLSGFLSCSKSEREVDTCEDTNTTSVTYSNTTAAALRVVVSATLTPQFEPVDPLFTIDLAAGQKVVKSFKAGKYFNTWYNGCPSGCNRRSYNFKTYSSCVDYEEKQ